MYKDLDKLIDSVANRVKTPAEASNLATTVWMAAGDAGLTICNLEPLAHNLECEPDMDSIMEAVRVLNQRLAATVNRPTPPSAAWYCAQVAQALNWERTEFDTLDELLGELRASEEAHSKFVDSAIQQNELMETVREKLREAEQFNDPLAVVEECVAMLDPLIIGKEPHTQQELCTAAILHGTEYYPGSTILLQTAQLVAWRDADGQEHCERAPRVTLNPDRDGLAAAILSGIAGAQIAPEHIAELRAQMGGVL